MSVQDIDMLLKHITIWRTLLPSTQCVLTMVRPAHTMEHWLLECSAVTKSSNWHFLTYWLEAGRSVNISAGSHHTSRANRAGFYWWETWGPWREAWAQWRIWDFRKGL